MKESRKVSARGKTPMKILTKNVVAISGKLIL
jgi:hypothetical protein